MDFGRFYARTEIRLYECPLHEGESDSAGSLQSDVIRLQPSFSGMRVLVLDK
jgi:hypothetical protein